MTKDDILSAVNRMSLGTAMATDYEGVYDYIRNSIPTPSVEVEVKRDWAYVTVNGRAAYVYRSDAWNGEHIEQAHLRASMVRTALGIDTDKEASDETL